MTLSKNSRVFFDETSHSYLLDDDVILIGVTSLMKKHNLSPDYSNIPEAVLNKAAKEGTEIHKEIEAYDSGETVLTSTLIDEYKKLGLKPIANEYLVSDNESVASSIDGVYEGHSPKSVILIDYKTTEKYHKRPLEWQLGIYKVLFERQNPDITVEGCFCLHIDKKTRTIKGLIPVEPVTVEEVDALLEAERQGLIYIDDNAESNVSLVLSDEEVATLVTSYGKLAQLKDAVKKLEESVKGINNKILSYMLDHNITKMESESGSFSVRAGYERTTVDSATLKRLYPAVFSKVTKTSKVAPSLTFKEKE